MVYLDSYRGSGLGLVEKVSEKENYYIKLSREAIDKRYFYRASKRLVDIIGSTCGLVILSPLFLAAAIWIKTSDSKGPVFYSQTRVGRNEREFTMFKFRSMYVNADEKLNDLLSKNEVEGPMFKMKDDPRVTPVGKIIRKYSIDELPQLWNVLKGDMSLVGPRPPLEREVAEYTNYDKQRLLVKPGCTGWWQVNERNNTGFSGMVKRDIEYVQNQSLIFDFKIILKTIKVVIHPNDAY